MNRDRTVAVAACAVGAGLALFAVSRAWTEVMSARPAPLPPVHELKTGSALAPWLPALGLVALAGAGALLATRGLVRAAVGVLLLFCGFGVIAGAAGHLPGGWPVATALGGLLVAGAGGLTLVRGRRWPALGTRYERPAGAARSPQTDAELWDALDRGDDPTR
jgi:LPXTG-motif cell wall-anchored protein